LALARVLHGDVAAIPGFESLPEIPSTKYVAAAPVAEVRSMITAEQMSISRNLGAASLWRCERLNFRDELGVNILLCDL
jgi:hypothetical protein